MSERYRSRVRTLRTYVRNFHIKKIKVRTGCVAYRTYVNKCNYIGYQYVFFVNQNTYVRTSMYVHTDLYVARNPKSYLVLILHFIVSNIPNSNSNFDICSMKKEEEEENYFIILISQRITSSEHLNYEVEFFSK